MVNCSSRGLQTVPASSQLPELGEEDEMVLLLDNNNIQTADTVNISHVNIVHLDLSHNHITSLNHDLLPVIIFKIFLFDRNFLFAVKYFLFCFKIFFILL